ncbi:MAG: UDP-N-acetylmuramoyl-L-alanyl-D-glutamate--2,6-diaminopimelate ligase [Alphaproteobacteria bacterium]
MEGETIALEQGRAEQVEIAGLSADSRTVEPAYLFAALPGTRAHGRDFIADALSRGAAAVLAPPGTQLPDEFSGSSVPVITNENPRRQFALMAARFYGRQPRLIAAVTGTNGKTSVAGFVRQIWERLGFCAGSIGTLGVIAPGSERPGALTTPDPVELHKILSDLAGRGVEHLALEASSHGLEQYRLDGVRVSAAGFTNLSRDHLDYHDGMEAYFRAKMRLFDSVMAPGGTAVLNADAPEFDVLAQVCVARGHEIISYGATGEDLRLETAVPSEMGQHVTLRVLGRRAEMKLPLFGAFQAQNVLCALGLAIACGASHEAALEAIEYLAGAPGRLELVARHPNGAPVYIDYAHTPDALANVLEALRPHVTGRIALVFGCGGDRDPGKRPLMGAVASRLADVVIVTDDNPRSEDPAAIRSQIVAPGGASGAREMAGRAEAIRAAVAELQPDDLLLIAGKGHETGQIVGERVLPFDDAVVARAAVAEIEEGAT